MFMISTLINRSAFVRLLLCWLVLWPLCGKAEFVIDSKPQQWLMDTTGLLTASERENIISSLSLFNKNKGRKLVVLVVNTTGEESIDNYALNAFNSFNLAHENKDNDILLLLNWSEKWAHIERGYVSTSGAQFSSSTRSSSQYGFHHNSLMEGINTGIRLAGVGIQSTQPFTNAPPALQSGASRPDSAHNNTAPVYQPEPPRVQEKESGVSRFIASSPEKASVSQPKIKRPPVENPNRLHLLFFLSWIAASFALPWLARRYFSAITGIIAGIAVGALIVIYWHLTLSEFVEPGLIILGLVMTVWFVLAAADMPDGPAFRSLKVAYEIVVFIARIILIFRGSSGGKGGGGSSGGFNGGGGSSGGGGASGRW